MRGVDPEPLTGRRVAVTGAAGFIGSRVSEFLARAGARVVAVAPDLGWRPEVRRLITEGAAEHAEVDALTASPADLERTLRGVDTIVHLAYTPTPVGEDPVEHERACNIEGTHRLAESVPTSVDHFVFASSVMVYGNPGRLPVREDDPPRAPSPYGTAKRAAEELLSQSAESRGFALTSLRLSTVYGPAETVPRAIPNFIRAVLAGRSPVIRGAGDELRDYVHVDDVSRAVVAASTSPAPGTVCNLATGLGTSTAEIARRIIEATGADVTIEFAPGDRPATSMVCDVTRARETLGFTAEVSLEAGLATEIAWFAEHPELWSEQVRR